jgi:hypothetical protein
MLSFSVRAKLFGSAKPDPVRRGRQDCKLWENKTVRAED